MKTLWNRRQFLTSSAMAGVWSRTLPAFVAATVEELRVQAESQPATGSDAPILVLVQLAGGNDGLNTLVPFSDDHYHRARPNLRMTPRQVLRLNDEAGLHPALTGFKTLYDEGHLAIVQSVGYPNPNRSHFRSTDIWMTATDWDRVGTEGWVGRYFDRACAGADPTVGIAVGRQTPTAFASGNPVGVAVENPDDFRFHEGSGDAAEMADSGKYYRQMSDGSGSMTGQDTMESGGSVAQLNGSRSSMTGSPLDFLERTSAEALASATRIQHLPSHVQNQVSYPASRLGKDLKLVARFIGGGFPTRVFYVSHGGFDTHGNQLNTHQRLLGELGDATRAFIEDLKAMGQLDRVVLMTFSEFGRRVAENASGGTDHGAAAPLFLVGGPILPGLHGKAPALQPDSLLNGDPRFSTDFRTVYASVLEDWLRAASVPILGRRFPTIDLFR